jgi:hypothetical protein
MWRVTKKQVIKNEGESLQQFGLFACFLNTCTMMKLLRRRKVTEGLLILI